MSARITPLMKALLPAPWFQRIRASRSRAYQLRLLKSLGLLASAREYLAKNGSIVRYGPFSGMIYPQEAALNRHSIPKLLGTYELELHPTIELASKRKYDCVIDIGSAEGYYAVGLARLLNVPVYAYEPEPLERQLSAEMATSNAVAGLVRMGTLFTKAEIANFSEKRALVVCDCEGFEGELFDSESVLGLANWDLLIELHDSTLQSLPKLPWPHQTRVISAEPRLASDRYPEIAGLGSSEVLLSEFRGGHQYWLWCDSQRANQQLRD
jgi:hypothetical protein